MTNLTASTILPPGSTPLERALDVAFGERVEAYPSIVPSLWDADACPAHLLGHLAWALGVEEWDVQWPEDMKRAAIRAAEMINRRRGTLYAVEQVLLNSGVFSEIREWFEPTTTPFSTTEPGTFDITVFVSRSPTDGTESREVTPELLARLQRMVEAAKPLSRHFNLSASLGIDTESLPKLANVGTGWMLASTSGTLAPYHPFTSMPGLTAVITTPVHLLTSSGTLQ